MNVIQRPRAREFCATMRDYILSASSGVTFAVSYGGQTILEEEYVPDADGRIHIRRLGGFCELALWGVWCAGETSWQHDAAGDFTFLIDGEEDMTSFVMFSRMQTGKDADEPGVLSEVTQKVCRPGVPEYISGSPVSKRFSLSGRDRDGATLSASLAVSGTGEIATAEVGPDTAASLFGIAADRLMSYTVQADGGSMEFLVDHSFYASMLVFRFKNVYDMPETLCCTGPLTMAASQESTSAYHFGVERRHGIRVTDTYTIVSGPLFLRSDYDLYHNLLNSREAEVLADGQWLPVIIAEQKLERDFRLSAFSVVEFSFRMADSRQNGLIKRCAVSTPSDPGPEEGEGGGDETLG